MTRLAYVFLMLPMLVHAQVDAPPKVDTAAIGLYFEPNLGQADPAVKFLARGAGGTTLFTPGEVTFRLPRQEPYSMKLAGAQSVDYQPSAKLEGVSAYFTSNDRSKWLPSVPHYARLTAREIYRGVDVVYYNAGSRLEYDFIVKPGADASQIRLAFSRDLKTSPDGSLVMSSGIGEVVQSKPRVYQNVDGHQVEVAASYKVDGHTASFALGEYDHRRELIIDPIIVFASTFPAEEIVSLATDSSGFIYITGSDYSALENHIPIVSALPPRMNPFDHRLSFVSKLSYDANTRSWRIIFSTYFCAGPINKLRVDAAGNVYLAGHEQRVQPGVPFPLVNNLTLPSSPISNQYGFAAKLVFNSNTSTISIAYSTMLPGIFGVRALAVDQNGAAYIGGNAMAGYGFAPIGPQFPSTLGQTDGFVIKLVQNGSTPVVMEFASMFGGDFFDTVSALEVDSSGAIHVAGSAGSADFPTLRGFAVRPPALYEYPSFLMRMTSTGQVVYSTLFPGTILAIRSDAAGSVYLFGIDHASDLRGLSRVNPIPPLASGVQGFFAKIKYNSSNNAPQIGFFSPIPDPGAALETDFALTPTGVAFLPVIRPREPLGNLRNGEVAILKVTQPSADVPAAEFWATFGRLRPAVKGYDPSILAFAGMALHPDGSLVVGGHTQYGPYVTLNELPETGGQFHPSYLARISEGTQPAALSISKRGQGTVTMSTASSSYSCGQTCTVHGTGLYNIFASAAPGYVFAGWFGACTGTRSCLLTVDGLKSVHAEFGKLVSLNVNVTGSGSGKIIVRDVGECSSRCTLTVADSQRLKVDIEPAPGSVFVRWNQGCFTQVGETCRTVGLQGELAAEFRLAPPIATQGLLFKPFPPCRIHDSREMNALSTSIDFTIDDLDTRTYYLLDNNCLGTADIDAAVLNFTVVPQEPLSYLTVWPSGWPRPVVSTLNSLDARIKATAAIVPAFNTFPRLMNVYATNRTELIIDASGAFVPPQSPGGVYGENLAFYPVTPCRVVDTRNPNGPLGGPAFTRAQTRTFPVQSSPCGIPSTARAYSFNATVVPSEPFSYLTMWPTGSALPTVSTLNALTGAVTANAAITPAGTNGAIDVFFTNNAHFVLDINGYFAPPGQTGGLKFYPVAPCRISDTRNANGTFGGPIMAGQETRDYPIPSSACGIPSTARAYSLSATVVPTGVLGYLTLWPQGQPIPIASTLNATDGAITSNAAIVPAGPTGAIRAFTSNQTHLILDINGYFAP